MFGAIVLLALLPWLDTSRVRSCRYRPIYRWFVLIFVADVILLGYVGGKPAEGIYVVLSKIGTAWYFLHFLVLTPIIGWIERPNQLPDSIADSVLQDQPMQTVPAE